MPVLQTAMAVLSGGPYGVADLAGGKNGLFKPFIFKNALLPRQARDKHRENGLFKPFIYLKMLFYQDRLGTNIGKTLQKRRLCCRDDESLIGTM